MQKHLLYINLFAITSALALTACADEVENAVTPDMPEVGEKTPIELSVGGVEKDAQTRAVAVITNPENKTLISLTEGTSIFMLMKSEYKALSGSYSYLNYGGTQASKYATTCGTVAEDDKVVFNNDESVVRTRYWDDAHARSSNLSIWAVACDGLQTLGGIGNALDESTDIFNSANGKTAWGTTEITATSLVWNVPNSGTYVKGQDADIIKNRDLLFSNNLANYSISETDADKDKRLKFDPTTNPKSFNGGKLIFYHALSKITINIKIGDGFTETSKFEFPAGKNVQLNHFNIWGKFSTVDGEFKEVNRPYNDDGHASINSIYNTTGTTPNKTAGKPAYVLEALVLPSSLYDTKVVKGSRFISGNPDAMMEFTIDNNAYKISSDALYKAMHVDSDLSKGLVANAVEKTDNGTYIPLEAGKNYIFTFVVGKTQIKNITAQVAEWETVEATETTPSNARIKLQLEERGTPLNDGVAFYKAEDSKKSDGIDDNYATYKWTTGYTNLGATFSTDHWTTNYFWESSKDFYHFRAVMPKTTVVKTADSKDYFEISSSSCANANSYDAVAWGAPMLDVAKNDVSDASTLKWNYGPTKNGFDADDNDNVASGLPSGTTHQIYKAIGPTEDPVKLILFHMMSGVHFTIKTDATSSAKVQLYSSTGTKRTKVELVGYYPSGKVLLGSGLVNVDGSISSLETGDGKVPPYEVTCATTSVESYANQEYFFSAVPQDLTSVKLYITTPDNNQYIVDLYNVAIAIDSDNNHQISSNNIENPYTLITDESDKNKGKYRIDRWYPGFKYNYTFKLLKTGITDLQATIVAWENVEADEETVVIQ